MRFLPIVERELRAASRRRGTYWNRALAALSAILVFAGTVWFEGRVAPKELGKDVFRVLSGLFLFSSLIAGIRYTADSLSEEKREGTLGLLFLTDLKGYDVVLGKLAANSLNSFYGILAILPILGVPLLMGGVTPAEVARVSAVLVNTMFLSVCIGIYASSSSRSARKSIGLTFFLMLVFSTLLPVLSMWLQWQFGIRANRGPDFQTPL